MLKNQKLANHIELDPNDFQRFCAMHIYLCGVNGWGFGMVQRKLAFVVVFCEVRVRLYLCIFVCIFYCCLLTSKYGVKCVKCER